MRAKWLVVAAWVLLAIAAAPLQPRLQQLAADESDAFRSESAESTRVDRTLESRFAGGGETTAVVAYTRATGITPADEARIKQDAQRICHAGLRDLARVIITDDLSCGSRPIDTASAGTAATVRSADNTTWLTIVQTRDDTTDVVVSDVAAIRRVASRPGAAGLRAYVTGEAAFAADQSAAFEGIDGTLLLATVALVAFLLLIIYRSPLLALLPLLVVGIAYIVAAAAVYAGARAGLYRATGQATSILIVLMFGVGTDYCLLLIARRREEASLATALRRTAPTIVTAGGIVVAVMLVLTLASYNATRWMGPVLALGTLVTVAACLTLLPALLAIIGDRAVRSSARSDAVWSSVTDRIRRRPRALVAGTLALLLLGSLGNLATRGQLDFTEQFRDPPESIQGLEHLRATFPPGQLGPTQVIVDTKASAALLPALKALPHVVGSDAVRFSKDHQALTQIDVLFDVDPFSDKAAAAVTRVREVARSMGGLVGGATAQQIDSRGSLRADAELIMPIALLLVFVIVAVLLRALVAPLYVVASVLLSYAFALGASSFAFTHVFGQPDGDPAQPLFTFVFLIALGVDYNVFLIARIRESGSVTTALERTGGVITSAGLILAGTFCTLLALKLEGLFQVGFTVALGLLVDTFLVRVVLVPGIAILMGERSWWPRTRILSAR
ncbi:MAG TPA: MMPL family transporter [Solirubrobacter sp.]